MKELIFDKMHEECAVFGIYNHPEAAKMTYLGLYALQHRGQEGSGIVSSNGKDFHIEKGVGLVSDIFTQESLKKLPGTMAIGHNRYSTFGGNTLKNVHPLMVNYALGTLAMAHNGNLTNAHILRDELEAYGAIFQSTVDSEVIVHLIAHSKGDTLIQRMTDALSRVSGAFSLVFLSEEGLIGVRDPYGVRPLSLGKLREGYVIASESSAFDLIEAEYIREIAPGEIVLINEKGVNSYSPFQQSPHAFCIFEHIYFAKPDSFIFGENVYAVRKRLGLELAREFPVSADVVIPVPDSGTSAALGYSLGSGIPYEYGLIRNHYVGRTFIEPEQSIRHFGVKIKLNAVKEVLKGKRVIVIDDSLVRGTTSMKIVKMIRDAGAREVHLRISSPSIVSPCFYGINTPTKKELIASTHSIEEIREFITADSLAYLSMEGLLRSIKAFSPAEYCTACFTGDYPIPIQDGRRNQLSLFETK
ncbi:MAG: amidophosphoribosyltransferase [Nitrospirae bacterium]|nr:amidophosphoribosyltransferase [Nitrospirota bacterium]MBI3594145.1 amidophosphoribosyltransferase [Nitrospirota bacterium]